MSPRNRSGMGMIQGTLDLLVLQTLATLGPMHGYGIARRLEQVSDEVLQLNQGTLYPALTRLTQKGWIRSEWGTSDNNRRARFYDITRSGRERLEVERDDWRRVSQVVELVIAEAAS